MSMDTHCPGLLACSEVSVFGLRFVLHGRRVALPYMQYMHGGMGQLANSLGMIFCFASVRRWLNGACLYR